nr:PTS sugar transporter subunit IIA [Ornithinibacillus scapharcae]
MCTLEKPITWSDKPVQFVCLLCVKKNSQEDLQTLYELLGKIIESRTTVQKLIKAQTHQTFMRDAGQVPCPKTREERYNM